MIQPCSYIFRPYFLMLVVLALGVFSTGLALLIYFRLLKTLGPLGVASQAYLRAGVGVALGAIILGEIITPAALIGICAALLGVALINAPNREPENPGKRIGP